MSIGYAIKYKGRILPSWVHIDKCCLKTGLKVFRENDKKAEIVKVEIKEIEKKR